MILGMGLGILHVELGTRKMAARLGLGTSDDRGRAQRKALLGEDDATMVFETSKEVKVVTTFDQMNLREDLLRGIYAYGKRWGGPWGRSQ